MKPPQPVEPAVSQESPLACATPHAHALDELAEWMTQGLLPELTTTRQRRSLQNALAMLTAGRRLLETRSLEELSVEAVCQEAGTTVGAFYGRFESKLAFFVTMQRLQTLRSRIAIDEFYRRHADTRQLSVLCEALVELTVSNFRENAGVLRASLQHTREGMWNVFKESGDRYRKLLEDKFASAMPDLNAATRRLRILFAYQALAGVLVHAVLNDPGPLSLHDPELTTELVQLMLSYLTTAA